MPNLIQFKAGRCERRGTSKWVDPVDGRGVLSLDLGDDGLTHLTYRNLENNSTVEDLILFPGDATFAKVPNQDGRVYVLKFSSSSGRHFFWLQDPSTSEDSRIERRMNQLIDDPESQDNGDAMETESTVPEPVSQAPASTSNAEADQMSQLQGILNNLQGGGFQQYAQQEELSLADVIAPSQTRFLLDSPESLETLYQYLPTDTKVVPRTRESVRKVLESRELRRCARSLDAALKSGALGPLAQSLGLPNDACFGVMNFLAAIQKQADEQKKGGDAMQTD